MNPMPELAPLLKHLRLSGILDSLEVGNRQAIEQKLAATSFLALLIQDEVARREQKKLHLRLRRASFRSQKTLEQFDFDFNPSINRALIQDLATGRYLQEKVAVLIAGPCGTGKSHLAQALGHCAVRQGYDVLFTTQTQLLGSARTLPAPPPASSAASRSWLACRCWSSTTSVSSPCVHPMTRTSTTSSVNATSGPPPSSPVTSTSASGGMPFPTACWGRLPWIGYATPPIALSWMGKVIARPDLFRRTQNRPLPRR